MNDTIRNSSEAGRPCPVCGKPAIPAARPFCSTRCANRDLGHWLEGGYRIPTPEAPGEDGDPEGDDA